VFTPAPNPGNLAAAFAMSCFIGTPQITYSATAATATGPSSVPDLDATIAK
jgi:hypothetical protein